MNEEEKIVEDTQDAPVTDSTTDVTDSTTEETNEETLDGAFSDEQTSSKEQAAAPKKEYAPIKTKTKVDLDTRAALARDMILSSWLPFAILSGILMAFGVGLWIFLEDDTQYIGIMTVILGFVIPMGLFGMSLVLAKFNVRKAEDAYGKKTIDMTFDDSIHGVETNEGNGDERTVAYAYDVVLRVRESSKYFFLYMDNRSAIVVQKSGIEDGRTDDLREMLRERCVQK